MTDPRKPTTSSETPIELLIQRCADGELAEGEEQGLLSRLEFQPDGWRTLALSFIEARVLSRASQDWLAKADVGRATAAPYRRSRRSFRRAGVLAALGLSVLVAFAVGRFTQPVARSTDSIADSNELRSPERDTDVALQIRDERRDSAEQVSLSEPAMYVSLNVAGAEDALSLPVYAAPAAWQPFAEPVLSIAETEALRRAGFQVESQQRVMRFQAEDGREVLLPVQSVGVRMARY